MKKIIKRIGSTALTAVLCTVMLWRMPYNNKINAEEVNAPVVTEIPGTVHQETEINGSFLSVTGFASAGVNDRSQYQEGDEEYVVVENEAEFIEALDRAEYGEVHVIEIRSDLYLGWNELPEEVRENAQDGVLEMSPETDRLSKVPVGNPVTIESGISRITLQDTKGLTIFSATGNTIYHAEFKFNAGVSDLVIRNLEFDEIWEWEDWRVSGYGSTGGHGTGTRTGWSFIKINGAKNVWIDHCNFGIAFDDNVGIENGASGISITWCKFGDIDLSVGSMLYKTLQYMEALYQKSKLDESVEPFVMYEIMRDNGMTLEEIGMIMGYHSKCHMTGAGDKDSWLYKDSEGNLVANTDKTDANELLRLTLAYNSYTSIGSRVPMLRSGVGHLYNCYTNNELLCRVSELLNSDPMNTGKTIMEQVDAAGGRLHPMSRGMDARNGASIAADTCVYEYMDNAIVGTAYHPNGSNISDGFENYWKYNYALIVNSSTTQYGKEGTYTGSSWDNMGDNPFINNADYYKDAEEIIGNWSWGQEGEELSYSYQTFPLEDVKDNMELYGGFGQIDMEAEDWLKVTYDETFPLKTIDKTVEIPISSIRLSKEEAVLYMEEEFLQLDAIALPCNTTEKASEYEWTSSNPETATVNDAGLVLPVAPGITTITVKTKDGLTATCEVEVTELPDSIRIIGVPDTIRVGDVIQLSAELEPQGLDNTNVLWENGGIRMTLLDEERGIYRADKEGSNPVTVYSKITGNRVGTKTISAKRTLKILPALEPVTDDAVDATGGAVDATGGAVDVTGGAVDAVMQGDYDGDKTVSLTDAKRVLMAALKIEIPTARQAEAADVDGDGMVELADAKLVLEYALKIISKFPG